MMRHKSFCVFILSHGRSDRLYTLDLLTRGGYSGKIMIIIDDEDDQRELYEARFPGQVIVFNKAEQALTVDGYDNSDDRRSPVYARNYCWEAARNLGVKYFLMLDDDYTNIHLRFDKDGNYTSNSDIKLDPIFDVFIDFIERSGALSVAMAQGGDFMGGKDGLIADGIPLKRKAMNTWFCKTDRQFEFVGKMNDDVNTYVTHGSRGGLFFTVMQSCIEQPATQSNPGGMAEYYLDHGTYVKSFFTVLCHPSSVKITTMGRTDRRIHHKIIWRYTVPKILSEKYRRDTWKSRR